MVDEVTDRRPLAESGTPQESGTARAMPALVVAAITIAGIYFSRPVLEPLALALLLSLMLSPAVFWLQRRGLGRAPAVLGTVFLAFIVIVGLIAAIGEEAVNLMQNLPQYETNISTKVRSLSGVPGSGLFERVSHVFHDLNDELTSGDGATAAAGAGPPVPVQIRPSEPASLGVVREIVGPLVSPIASTGLVLLFAVMMLLKREDLRNRVLRLAGARDFHRTTSAMNEAAERVSRYLLMQLAVGITYGVPVGIGLWVIGIPNAALWGLVGIVLRYIPYLGGALTPIFPIALAIAVSPGWGMLAGTVLLFISVELVVGNVVEPWLYGRSTGLSPVAVTAAAVFWTWLWGTAGLLLATPLTVCLVVVGRHVPHLQFLDILLGNQPVLSPEETLYQRLLAHDPEEATEQAEAFAREKSIEAFFDEVALPALVMAQRDSDRGVLAQHRAGVLAEGFAGVLDNLAEDGWMEDEPTGQGQTVVCLAGRSELDLAAAWILRHMLRLRGHRAVVFAPDAVSAFNLSRLPLDGVGVVCLSMLGGAADARTRYLVRRLRRRVRRASIILGYWGLDPGNFQIAEVLAATAADKLVTGLVTAVNEIEAALGEPAPIEPPALLARQSA
ncbi:MAG: AI-2E family transporter [Alphaproteobacteria bacterium]|nr:AI-2E family transporter [Alphaproteobacteria bacterium]